MYNPSTNTIEIAGRTLGNVSVPSVLKEFGIQSTVQAFGKEFKLGNKLNEIGPPVPQPLRYQLILGEKDAVAVLEFPLTNEYRYGSPVVKWMRT